MNRLIFTLLAISASIGSPLMAQTNGSTTTYPTDDMKNTAAESQGYLSSAAANYRLKHRNDSDSQSIQGPIKSIQAYIGQLMQTNDPSSPNSLNYLKTLFMTLNTDPTSQDSHQAFTILKKLGANLENAAATSSGFAQALNNSGLPSKLVPGQFTQQSLFNGVKNSGNLPSGSISGLSDKSTLQTAPKTTLPSLQH